MSERRRCPWWLVWWHRRLRRIDRDVMWPALRRSAQKQIPDNEEDAALLALGMWAAFIQQLGLAVPVRRR